MDKNVWGKPMWSTIHLVALGYPDEPSADIVVKYNQFFISIAHVIPCDDCKKHFISMITDNPPALENKDALFKWTVDIHNSVNERLGKKTVSYDQAYSLWKNKQPDTSKSGIDYTYIILSAIIGLLVGAILCSHISTKIRRK